MVINTRMASGTINSLATLRRSAETSCMGI
jgi:hypothetical protein